MQLGDLARIRELARPEFVMPDLGGANILAKRVVESGAQLVAGAAARLTTEIHLFIDPRWESPRWRLEAIKFLQREMRTELREKGISEGVAWVIEPRWERRLVQQLGWERCAGTDLLFRV